MWKEYSISYMKRNKASSISIMVTGLIATLFFSMICCLFYNFWRYDTQQMIREEGDWQGRIVIEGDLSKIDIESIENHGNVAKVNTWQDRDKKTVVDIYFKNMRRAFQDMSQIAAQAGAEDAENAVISCHDKLLSQYMIFNPEDEQPPMLLRFFILVMALTAGSLILIIRNAFAVTMNARIHQMGILSSIGATPRQIRICLLQEAFALCTLPILLGSVGGIGLSIGFIRFMEWIARDVTGRAAVQFQYHPAVYLITVLASGLTVFLSAWFPARRMGKLTPLQAVQNAREYGLKRKKKSPILAALFGVEGELAGNALKARKSALRTSFISLTFSFGAFSIFLCFIALSEISVKYTYYERYKDSWDVMSEIEDAGIEDFSELPEMEEIRQIKGADSCVAYQKATAFTWIREDDCAEELLALGGFGEVSESAVRADEGAWQVKVPMMILDDEGFAQYCEQIGVKPQLDGSIMLNRIWDSVNSNFRYRKYIPFVKESVQELALTGNVEMTEEASARIQILAHTQTEPVLREEYDDYVLVQIIPVSLWRQISSRIGAEAAERNMYLRILAADDAQVYEIEEAVDQLLEDKYTAETENRVQDEITNLAMLDGYRLAVGILCVLLAVIGIANIFANTLGFLYQRKREFARYLSIGVTPEGIRKILRIEALVIAGKPILVTIPLTILFAAFAVTASYLDPWEFIAAAPIVPMLVFILFVFLFVHAAYDIGKKGLLRSDLCETLRDDVMS